MARKKRKAAPRPQVRHFGAEFQISPVALRLAVPALVVLFSVFAWLERGVYEDGFIYLRVAENLADGHGLVYNPGERYETNTDFLWSILLGLGVAAGVGGILWMHILGVAIFAASLIAAFAFARKLFSGEESAFVALVLLGGHFTFIHFAATGFAPVLQALAAVCCLLALFEFGKSPNLRNGAALGFALLFLALCRLDSAVFGIPLVLCALFFAWRNGKAALPAIALAMGIPAVLFGGVLLWKLSYYGDIFPAPYYAKAAAKQAGINQTGVLFRLGVEYVASYWREYFLWAFAPFAAFGFWRALSFRRKPTRATGEDRKALLWTMAAMCALWHVYMLRIGGGYYAFRFFAPQAPMLIILLAAGFDGLLPLWRRVAAGGVLVASILHGQAPVGGVFYARQVEGNDGPRLEISGGFEGIRLASEAMADVFGHLGDYHPQIKVATAGGLMAWRTKFFWVELSGYADPRIALADLSDLWHYPEGGIGHRFHARPGWLARHNTNLVMDPGKIIATYPNLSRSPRAWASLAAIAPTVRDDFEPPPDSQIFALPLADGRFIPVLYFNRNETIDRTLDERGIERVGVL